MTHRFAIVSRVTSDSRNNNERFWKPQTWFLEISGTESRISRSAELSRSSGIRKYTGSDSSNNFGSLYLIACNSSQLRVETDSWRDQIIRFRELGRFCGNEPRIVAGCASYFFQILVDQAVQDYWHDQWYL